MEKKKVPVKFGKYDSNDFCSIKPIGHYASQSSVLSIDINFCDKILVSVYSPNSDQN